MSKRPPKGTTPAAQPARAVLALLRLSVADVARALGHTRQWTSSVLNGEVHAPAKFRRELSLYLGLDEEELFRPGGRRGW